MRCRGVLFPLYGVPRQPVGHSLGEKKTLARVDEVVDLPRSIVLICERNLGEVAAQAQQGYSPSPLVRSE